MTSQAGIFSIERDDATLIILPLQALGELDFQQVERNAKDILALLEGTDVKHVVVDFQKAAWFGSTALGFFIRLWKRVRERGGRMAFCNLSATEKEILEVAKLNGLWPACPSRETALEAVRG